jgi:hypothetical protein
MIQSNTTDDDIHDSTHIETLEHFTALKPANF